jgi:hypothetical protein
MASVDTSCSPVDTGRYPISRLLSTGVSRARRKKMADSTASCSWQHWLHSCAAIIGIFRKFFISHHPITPLETRQSNKFNVLTGRQVPLHRFLLGRELRGNWYTFRVGCFRILKDSKIFKHNKQFFISGIVCPQRSLIPFSDRSNQEKWSLKFRTTFFGPY